MVRGRKPKPVSLHVIEGTFRKDRHGASKPKKQRILPEAPQHIRRQRTAFREWERVVAVLDRMGMIEDADAGILSVYCEAHAELSAANYRIRREGRIVATGTGSIKPHPAIAIKNDAARRLMKAAAELGLSPTARTRLRVSEDPDYDPEDADLD